MAPNKAEAAAAAAAPGSDVRYFESAGVRARVHVGVPEGCGEIGDAEVTPETEYVMSEVPQPHAKRRIAITRAHPDVATLMEKRPDTFLWVVGVVGVQLGLAYAVHKYELNWWQAVALAWCVGAFFCHGMWVLIHDLSHDSCFESPAANKVTMLLCNLPILFPAAMSFRHYHRIHHASMGETWRDPDLPGPWENKLFGWSPVGKAAWMFLFALMQSARTVRYQNVLGSQGLWVAANWAAQLAFIAAACKYGSLPTLLYLLGSSMAAIGLHPLGARWIAEHYAVRGNQETFSYYGSFNMVSFNVGHHNEHHDLPNVPWQNLPKLRAMAPEFYDSLWYHTSYWRLLIHFLLDPGFSFATRVVRESVSGAAISATDVDTAAWGSAAAEDDGSIAPILADMRAEAAAAASAAASTSSALPPASSSSRRRRGASVGRS